MAHAVVFDIVKMKLYVMRYKTDGLDFDTNRIVQQLG
jgi:hypothetical protein